MCIDIKVISNHFCTMSGKIIFEVYSNFYNMYAYSKNCLCKNANFTWYQQISNAHSALNTFMFKLRKMCLRCNSDKHVSGMISKIKKELIGKNDMCLVRFRRNLLLWIAGICINCKQLDHLNDKIYMYKIIYLSVHIHLYCQIHYLLPHSFICMHSFIHFVKFS